MWAQMFHQKYPGLPFDKKLLAKRFGVSYEVLDRVYRQGEAAGRPKGLEYPYAVARVYKYILKDLPARKRR